MTRPDRIRGLCLLVVVAVAGAGCGRSDKKGVALQCHSSDNPPLTAQVDIGSAESHQTVIVVRYPSTKPITFQVVDETSTYYSAIEVEVVSNKPAASLYFDRTSGSMIETFRTSDASREVRIKRCDGKIDAPTCKAQLAELVQGPARDLQDCDNPSAAECENWRKGSHLTSEVHLFCRKDDHL